MKHLGADHPKTLLSTKHLGKLYSSQKRYDEAEALCKRTLEGMVDRLGTDHPRTRSWMTHLANVYSSQGRHEEAETLHKRVSEGRGK
jgi:tetratricopeptide (TPR) repeat protein